MAKNCAEIFDVLRDFNDWTQEPLLQIPFFTIYLAIFLLGLISNSFVVYMVFKHSKIFGIHKLFVLNLAIADLLLCLISLPFSAYITVYKEWIFGWVPCNIIPFVQGLSVLISSFTLTVIAFDRYATIVEQQPISDLHRNFYIFAIWALAIFVSVPLATHMELKPGVEFYHKPLCGYRNLSN